MRLLYSFLYSLSIPAQMLATRRRAKSINTDVAWSERFGRYINNNSKAPIWLHVASLGEAVTAAPLIKAILKELPDERLLVTTGTPTGKQQLLRQFADAIEIVYLPFDLLTLQQRFLRAFQPKLGIMLETELWPNMLQAARAAKLPMLLASARISLKSYKGYSRFGATSQRMLQSFSAVLAQSDDDAARFADLGADAAALQVAGNIKFDLSVSDSVIERGKQLRRSFAGKSAVWIAASTHAGEDEQVLQAHKALLQKHPNTLLIIVPRHSERFDKTFELCQQAGFKVSRRSTADAVTEPTQVLLGDTMGEMMLFYAASDIAFVGGSLADIGGHNLLEPAAIGLPVLSGPHLQNFKAIKKVLLQHKALSIVDNEIGLAEMVSDLLTDASLRGSLGAAAKQVLLNNRGAVANQIEAIKKLL